MSIPNIQVKLAPIAVNGTKPAIESINAVADLKATGTELEP
jgi:hypothetical protein